MRIKIKTLGASATLCSITLAAVAQTAPVAPTSLLYGLTTRVPPTSNLRAAAAVFGRGSTVADWNVLKPQILTRTISLPFLYTQAGLLPGGSALVFRAGRSSLDGSQHYFVSRFDQAPPRDFKVIDRAGSLYLSAGQPAGLPAEIQVLATRSGARSFGLTSLVPETGNIPVQARVLGSGANLADWESIKAAVRTGTLSLATLYQQAGICDGSTTAGDTSVWVQRGGRRFWSGNRHYLMTRFDKGAPGYYLVHDSIGSLYLGSWHTQLPILARMGVSRAPSVVQASAASIAPAKPRLNCASLSRAPKAHLRKAIRNVRRPAFRVHPLYSSSD